MLLLKLFKRVSLTLRPAISQAVARLYA